MVNHAYRAGAERGGGADQGRRLEGPWAVGSPWGGLGRAPTSGCSHVWLIGCSLVTGAMFMVVREDALHYRNTTLSLVFHPVNEVSDAVKLQPGFL